MAKIQWKKQTEIDAEQKAQEEVKEVKDKLKAKPFKNLNTREKDLLLELMARQLGYIQ